MRGGSTIPDGAGRPGPCDNGILAAVLFALLSVLLIATVPDDAPPPPDPPLRAPDVRSPLGAARGLADDVGPGDLPRPVASSVATPDLATGGARGEFSSSAAANHINAKGSADVTFKVKVAP